MIDFKIWKLFENDPKMFEVPVKCKRCGRCCIGTEMELIPHDIERIVKLGYRIEDFTIVKGGIVRLRCVDDRCVFLDPEKKLCRIYEHRPIGCRLYPLQYSDGEIYVDPECPAADTVPADVLERFLPIVEAFVRLSKITREWLLLRYGKLPEER
ncbi:MAG: YkgJ family cysteine cluster protein [Crenarchaeota archaeon]|nr:YkgJ family cysteine cluster protein [Thermoproteota archaeon]